MTLPWPIKTPLTPSLSFITLPVKSLNFFSNSAVVFAITGSENPNCPAAALAKFILSPYLFCIAVFYNF